MRHRVTLAIVLLLAFFWACHLGPEDGTRVFAIDADSTWTAYSKIRIEMLDDSGHVLATLFDDTLRSLDQLGKLPAEAFPGGDILIRIVGFRGDSSVFEQSRRWDARTGKTSVDTLKDPWVMPGSIILTPADLTLRLGGEPAVVEADVVPSYADRNLLFSVEDEGVVLLAPDTSKPGRAVRVEPLKVGRTRIKAVSATHPSTTAFLPVKVESAALEILRLEPSSLLLYRGGKGEVLHATLRPATADPALEWTSENAEVATVDSTGLVRPGSAGQTRIRVKPRGYPESESVSIPVSVKQDAPILVPAASIPEPGIGETVVYACTTRQEYGSIHGFAWDLDADGRWDDSLPGVWPGTIVVLPAVSARYAREGRVMPRFRVEDSEGNKVEAALPVDVRNRAPEILRIRKDTLISIRDSVPMSAAVSDRDGGIGWVGWDYQGDGTFDDTSMHSDSVVEVRTGYRYPAEGKYGAVLEVRDRHGGVSRAGFEVRVERDPPVADAGRDTTVVAGTLVHIRAGGTDEHGAIVKREVRIGGFFATLSNPDTSFPAPSEPTVLTCIIRITDDDGLSDEDTVLVAVVMSSVADLAGILPSAGVLEPAFNPSTLHYSATVPFKDSLVRVTPVSLVPGSRIAVNGRILASGSASDPVRLPVGGNPAAFLLVVTAADGRTQRVYDLSITRERDAESRLKQLLAGGFSLKPAFSPSILEYADTVPSGIAAVTLRPVVLGTGAVVSSGGKDVPPGDSLAVPLKAGENDIDLDVTAQDGSTRTRYRIRVFRQVSVTTTRVSDVSAAVRTGSFDVLPGRPFHLESAPVDGFHFRSWRVAEGQAEITNTQANPTSGLAHSASVVLEARWQINTYSVTAASAAGGSVVPASMTIVHGRDTSIQLSPSPGYRVLSLTENGQDVTPLLTGDLLGARGYRLKAVTGSRRLEARFLRIWRATGAVADGKGEISLSATAIDSGKSLVVSLTPQVGYTLSGLTVNGRDVLPLVAGNRNGPTTFAVAQVGEDHVVSASFSLRTFQLTLKSGVTRWGGTVVPVCIAGQCGAEVKRTVNYGESVAISTESCYPVSCGGMGCSFHRFSSWSGSGGAIMDQLARSTSVVLTDADATYQPQYVAGGCTQ